MASTQQLAVGYTATWSVIKSKWLKVNHDRGYEVQVSQNIAKPKARYFSVCFTAPKMGWTNAECCKAHVKAMGDDRSTMSIVSVDTNHTCGMEGIRRKRNYLTHDIADVSIY